jgi:SAM-dependent methyltransferase
VKPVELPELTIPADLPRDDMPDLLRHWYLGTRARRHMMLRRFREVDGELDMPSGSRVLDIGSAWGYNVMALGRMGYRAVGMDLVVDQFGVGRRIAGGNDADFDVVGADAAGLPFGEGTFDAVTMVETFEHIYLDDRPRALAEIRRVLRPGGRLVMSTPNHASLVEAIKRATGRHEWIRRRLPTMCYPEEGTAREEYHPYRYHHPLPDHRIVALIEGAGLRLERVKHFLFTLKNTPDSLAATARVLERLAEHTPGLRRAAATSCFIAVRPGN